MRFSDIIGQAQTKKELYMRLDAFESGEPMPSLLFVAPRGKGKTSMATATGLEMKARTKGVKRYFELNASSIKNQKMFWDSVMIPMVNDRDITLLIDEAHQLPMDVMNCLLTLINPNSTGRNSYTYEDVTVDFDMKRQTFFFATTETQKLFYALVNRCRRIDLEDYSQLDISYILKRNMPGFSFEKGVAEEVASTLRGTPRQAVMMAQDIKTFLSPKKRVLFTNNDWQQLSEILGVLPMGLTRLELRVMEILSRFRDCSLTRLAAAMQMSPSSVRNDLELYLLSSGLMKIDVNGRNLTGDGVNYLNKLKEN